MVVHTNKRDTSNQSWLATFIDLCQFTAQTLWPVYLGLIIVYFLIRIAFTTYHFDKLQGISAIEWITLYLNGLRFDLAALSPFLLLFFIVTLLPFQIFRRFFWWTVTAATLLFILLNGADIVLMGFTGRRFSKSSLVLVGEGSWKNLLDYTRMATFTAFVLVLSFWVSQTSLRRLEKSVRQKNGSGRAVLTFVVLIVTVILGRGGLQLKPISFVDAKVIAQPMAHQVVLNSTFTFFTSFGKKGLEKESHFSTEEMQSYLNLNPAYSKDRKSVV